MIAGPIVAGISTTAFSLIMFVLTDGYGLTSAIPLLFGSAMLLGVLATYAIEPKGRAVYIFTGVAILFGAVIMNTVASTWVHELLFMSSLNNKRKQKPENKALLENDESKTSETAVEVQEEAPKTVSN